MLRREMTDPAATSTFKRLARGALVGLALAGLAGCGGGGGSTAATPKTPEITITPAAPMAQLEAATAISAGEDVTGTLASADDVKYYRLEVAETSVVEFTIDAEAGIEIALLDSGGLVLVDATTASEATARVAVPKGTLFARVSNSPPGRLLKRVNQQFRLAAKITRYAAYAGTVINLLRGEVRGTVPIGTNAEVKFDVPFNRSDGGPIAYKISGAVGVPRLPGHLGILAKIADSVEIRIERNVIKATATSGARPGPIVFSLCAAPADTGNINTVIPTCVPFNLGLVGTVKRKTGVPGLIEPKIKPGGTFTSEPFASYFEYPEGANVRFSAKVNSTPLGGEWMHSIEDGRLKVSNTEVSSSGGGSILLTLSIIDNDAVPPDPNPPYVRFSITVETEEEEPGGGGELEGEPLLQGGMCRTGYDLCIQFNDGTWCSRNRFGGDVPERCFLGRCPGELANQCGNAIQ